MLQGRTLTLREIAHMVEQNMRDTEEDLKHLFRSLKHADVQPYIEPAACRKCGFEFGTDKLHKPSKCPKCHATWLTEPRIGIVSKGNKDTDNANIQVDGDAPGESDD